MRYLVSSLFIFIFSIVSFSQCTINSANGYSVGVSICPNGITVSSSNCPNGYNYNVNFSYQVVLSGPNLPNNLYTLQTEILCNTNQVNGYYSLPLTGGSGNALTTTNPFINNDGTAYLYITHPSCVFANTTNLGCNSIKVKIQGPGIPTQTVNCSCGMVVLPLELGEFKCLESNKGNQLIWNTISEKNNDFFTLLSSIDGINWNSLAVVKSQGDSEIDQNYEFLDSEALPGRTYYKLVQQDKDGRTNELALTSGVRVKNEVELFPNPVSPTTVNSYFSRSSSSPVTVRFISNVGQVVYQLDLPSTSDLNGEFSFQHAIPVPLTTGNYRVEFEQNSQQFHSEQLVIQ